jgi:DnaJ domain
MAGPERTLTITQALDVLSLPLSASQEDVHAAWRKAARRTHPDHNPGNPGLARQRFDQVQEAYRVLTNPAVVAERRLAIAAGPLPPYSVDQLDAFRALGLGPHATYDEIDARLAQLLSTEADAGKRINMQAAHERLTKPHRDAQSKFASGPRPLGSGSSNRRQMQASERPSGVAALLFVVIGLGLIFGGVLLITTRGHAVIAEIAIGVGVLVCLFGALRWAV